MGDVIKFTGPTPPVEEPEVEAAMPTEREDMSEMTRPEFDAKLEAIEARMDARVARIEGLIESMRNETRSAKNWAMGTVVAVVLSAFGTVWGVYGANASIVQAVITAFQAGQAVPALPSKGK